MTPGDLIAATTWPDVKAALLWLFPECRADIRAYQTLLRNLRRMRPISDSMRISIEPRPYPDDESEIVMEVVGRDGTLNKELEDFRHFNTIETEQLTEKEVAYSLCLRSWSNWLGMAIDPKSESQLAPAQIIAYCLDEMTFHGFSESDANDFGVELNRRVAEFDTMTPEVGAVCWL